MINCWIEGGLAATATSAAAAGGCSVAGAAVEASLMEAVQLLFGIILVAIPLKNMVLWCCLNSGSA